MSAIQGTSWHSYSKIYALGHKATSTLLTGQVVIEEKVDGSQFSFGVHDGQLRVRSKNIEILTPDKMFAQAVATAEELKPLLIPGYTYRCEYLRVPKHNTIEYARIPNKHLLLYDVEIGNCSFLDPEGKQKEANRLGLECVPLYWHGPAIEIPVDWFTEKLSTASCLGGSIEGLVIKNYDRFDQDGKVLMGKFVRADFQELNSSNWKKTSPKSQDILQILGQQYRTEARWRKAVQHLKEQSLLKQSMQDMKALIEEVKSDILVECEAEIKDCLFKWAVEAIMRQAVAGLPEWYKAELENQILPNQDTEYL